MKLIRLTKGLFAKVDDSDFTELSKFNWWALTSGTGPTYAARKHRVGPCKWQVILMHRQIIGAIKGQKVDHRFGGGLDNQRHNLRIATDQQNQRGYLSHRVGKTSSFRGVHLRKKSQRWVAQISVDKRIKYLGSYASEISAARAYDAAAKQFFGEFASPNFK